MLELLVKDLTVEIMDHIVVLDLQAEAEVVQVALEVKVVQVVDQVVLDCQIK
jgi:hypothetical protein